MVIHTVDTVQTVNNMRSAHTLPYDLHILYILYLVVYHIFIKFGILGWIQSGHGIQNPFVHCECIRSFDVSACLENVL